MSSPSFLIARLPRSGSWSTTSRRLLANAGSLVGTTAVTSLLGAAYWWLAARTFAPVAVGLASAAVSAMTVLGAFANLGLGTMLMGELPRRDRAGRQALVSASLAVTAVLGAAFGVAFAFAVPVLSSSLSNLTAEGLNAVLFVLGVTVAAFATVLDQALIGLLRGGAQLWRNTVFAVAKLAALGIIAMLVSHDAAIAIYGAWTAGTLVSIGLLARRLRMRRSIDRTWLPRWSALHGVRRTTLGHYAFNVALSTPRSVLPVLAVAILSARANAGFYIAQMIANFVYVVPTSLATVLFATSAADPASLRSGVRLSLRISGILCAAAAVVLLIAGHWILALFGDAYAADASTLRILVLAALPLILKAHFVAVSRAKGQVARRVPLVWAGTLLELGAAATGGRLGGIDGLALGWLLALCLEAVVAAPTVLRTVRGA